MGLEVKIYDTPAGGIGASQGTFSSSNSYDWKSQCSKAVDLCLTWQSLEDSLILDDAPIQYSLGF